jgi:hypothetical protein
VNFVLIGLLAQIIANAAEAIRLLLVQVRHLLRAHIMDCGSALSRSGSSSQPVLQVHSGTDIPTC